MQEQAFLRELLKRFSQSVSDFIEAGGIFIFLTEM
jgi:hypothetical protein